MWNRFILRGSFMIVAAFFFTGCAEGLSPTRPSSFSASAPAGGSAQPQAFQGKVRKPNIPIPTPPPPVKAVVAAELDVLDWGTANKYVYGIGVRLTESAGVSATITNVFVMFDEGWGDVCSFSGDQFWQSNLPANGTLFLEPVACENSWAPWSVEIGVTLKDDRGNTINVWTGKWFGDDPKRK